MTAIHLFRSVLVALTDPKTFSPALLMRRRDTSGSGASRSADAAQQPPEAKAWRRTFDLALVDASGWLNLAAGVSRAAAAAARDAAARTLQLLNSGTPDAFAAAFLTPQPRAALCDYWFHVRMPPAPDGGAEAGAAQQNGGQGRCGDLLRDQPSWRCVGCRRAATCTATVRLAGHTYCQVAMRGALPPRGRRTCLPRRHARCAGWRSSALSRWQPGRWAHAHGWSASSAAPCRTAISSRGSSSSGRGSR